jgi:hypothetical protein
MDVLTVAIARTFTRRATGVPASVPVPLTAAFAEDPGKQAQWAAFLTRTKPTFEPPPLANLAACQSD